MIFSMDKQTEAIQVLIIEDDIKIGELLSYYLDGLKTEYIIHIATSIAEGVELLKRLPIDIILLDLDLPDSPPQRTIDQYIGQFSVEAAIIVLTGSIDIDYPMATIREGGQQFISKTDIIKEDLEYEINAAIERQVREKRYDYEYQIKKELKKRGQDI
jgi:DNA-binding NarL/FixJ family response regulator